MKDTSYIQMVLEELGITSYEDYVNKMKVWEDFDNRVFYGGQDKIDSLRKLVVDYYDSYQYDALSGQYISIDPASFKNEKIENYMCLFPKRALIETSTLLSYIDLTPHDGEEYDLPPNDFFKQYFRFQNLIDHNIAHLYPIKTDEETSRIDGSIIDSSSLIPLRQVAMVTHDGSLDRLIIDPNMVFTAFPWLFDACAEDYIEICEKNPTEFDHLAIAIEKIAQVGNGKSDLQEALIMDLKEALVNIQIEFEKKKADLIAKGKNASVGLVLTGIPWFIPNFSEIINPALYSSFIGGISLKGGLKLINDFFALRNTGKDNPYWVIWKWKTKTPDLLSPYTFTESNM